MKYLFKFKYEKYLILTVTKLVKFNYKNKLCGHLNPRILGNHLSLSECFQTAFRHLLATNNLCFKAMSTVMHEQLHSAIFNLMELILRHPS